MADNIGNEPGSSQAKAKGTLDSFISTVGAAGLARPNRYRVFFKGRGPVEAAQYVQARVEPTLKARYSSFSVDRVETDPNLLGGGQGMDDEDMITRKKTQKSLAGGEAAGGMASGLRIPAIPPPI